MRAKAPALKTFAREAFERGVSLREIARVADLPLGTVKVWRSRGKWRRADHQTGRPSDKGHETPVSVGKKEVDETHRGLRACHMPGARAGSKQMTFALFKRNLWPPAVWKVPPGLVGGELLMMLQERASLGLAGKGKVK